MKPSLKSIYFFIGYAFFTNFLSMHASTTLPSLITASTGVARIPNDVGGYMHNYVTQHFSPAGTRLSSCCNMANATFSGTSADSGVVLGVENNTGLDFLVMQNSVIIDVLKPGMNDVALHLASLISSTGTTSVTSDITFVPKSGAQSSQVRLRVLTGAQLSTHMTNISTAQGGAFLKNGTNSLPGVGQLAATSSDQYLVVETVSTDSSKPLNAAEQRIQVLNLTNITNIYTLILEINLMGLVFEAKGTVSNGSTSTVDKVSEYASLNDTYLVSIKNVHILNEVSAHVVPLLVLPRKILQSGTSLNLPYATYIQSYSNYIAGKNAGAAKEYYDLMINYVAEPYGYLNALHYFDTDKSLLAVVDQSANLASGTVLDSVIGTDVYATSLALSSDLSLVYTAQDANGNTVFDPGYEHLEFGFDIDSMKQKVLATDIYDVVTPGAFPTNRESLYFFQCMAGDEQQIAIHLLNWGGGDVYGGGIMAGNSTNITEGVSYNEVGSFSSSFFTLQIEDWSAGIRFIPVYYNESALIPILTMEGLNAISGAAPAALYFYAFRVRNGKFIGLIPVLTSNMSGLLGTQTFTRVIQFYWGVNYLSQSPNYNQFAVGKNGDTNLVVVARNLPSIDYPGYCDLIWNGLNINFSGVRNLVQDVATFAPYLEKAWSIDNGDGSDKWMISVPKSAIKNGIDIHVSLLSNQNYEMVLRDNQQNILGFRQFTTSQANPTLMINHILSSSGAVDWFNTPTQLVGAKNVFNIKGSGNTLTAVKTVAAPVAVVPAPYPTNVFATKSILPSGQALTGLNYYLGFTDKTQTALQLGARSLNSATKFLAAVNKSLAKGNVIVLTAGLTLNGPNYDATVAAYNFSNQTTPIALHSFPCITSWTYDATTQRYTNTNTPILNENNPQAGDSWIRYTTSLAGMVSVDIGSSNGFQIQSNVAQSVAKKAPAADKKDKKHDKKDKHPKAAKEKTKKLAPVIEKDKKHKKDKKHHKPAKKTKAEIKAKIAKLQAEESAAA
ncbi:MAG: hypothetical protein NTU89_00310 [Candidatus Dependentiae bacterium]|nr:hypothetical protein [Candidatus Dependentiae bacterium]